MWRLEGPEGPCQVRTNGNVRSNSGEFVHAAICAGLGLGLRSTWEIGPQLKSGALKIVLPKYRGSRSMAIYAVYPCREFMPAKVTSLIEFLAELYGAEPYWDKGLDLAQLGLGSDASKTAPRGAAKGSRTVIAAR